MIKKSKGKYAVKECHGGKRTLGKHKTLKKAKAQHRAIAASRRAKK